MTRPARQGQRARGSYELTPALVAAHAGGPVVCLDLRAIGRTFALYPQRPGAELNERVTRSGYGLGPVSLRSADVARALAAHDAASDPRAEIVDPSGNPIFAPPIVDAEPFVTIVSVRGVIEQRAGYHDECGGWSDGHDAIAERLIAALEDGDVFLDMDSPGGAHAGLEAAVHRVLDAKARLGRRVTGYANEMVGSAMAYWAFAVCDELWCPPCGIIGSIGARASHECIEGALAIAGVAVTYACWPDAGKVAFAPELPLSDEGKARLNRDVSLAGEGFALAVVNGPVGQRYGLTRDAIADMHADAFTGAEAQAKGLCDGVAPIEDVMAYALGLAGEADDGPANDTTEANMASYDGPRAEETSMGMRARGLVAAAALAASGGIHAAGVRAGGVRAEGDDEDDEEGGPEKVPSDCKACGLKNEDDAKFCKGCGSSLGTAPAADKGDDAPPSSEPAKPPPPGGHPPPPQQRPAARTAQPSGAGTARSLNAMLGIAESASLPALKSAALPFVCYARARMAALGARSLDELEGAERVRDEEAASTPKLRETIAKAERATERHERMDLLRQLAAAGLPGFTRGELFSDVGSDGNPLPKGQLRPSAPYRSMPIGELRGWANAKLAAAPARPQRDPFQPREPAPHASASAPALAAKYGIDPEALAAADAYIAKQLTGQPGATQAHYERSNAQGASR